MLVFGCKNDTGYELHALIGPESEFHLDIHGAVGIELTPLLRSIPEGARISLALTRCRSEMLASQLMSGANVVHLSSAPASATTSAPAPGEPRSGAEEGAASGEEGAASGEEGAASGEEGAAPRKAKREPVGRCSYCGRGDSVLADIPDFRICMSCVRIELGRMRAQAEDKVFDATEERKDG